MGTSDIDKHRQPPWSTDRDTADPTHFLTPTKMGASSELDSRKLSTETPNDQPEGIFIPAFLQPLLGLDFVPYMPKDVESTNVPAVQESNHLSDDDLKALGLMGEASESTAALDEGDLMVPSSPALPETIQEPASLSTLKVAYEPVTTSPKTETSRKRERRGSKLKTRISSFVKGKSRRRANSTPNAKKIHEEQASPSTPRTAPPRKMSSDISISWHDDSENGENDADLPKRKIEFSSSPHDSAAWIKEQRKELDRQVTNLNNVQQEAKNMQTRTAQIHKRIGQVQNEMSTLQKALKKAEDKLSRELTNFDNARSELARLEASAIQASEAVIQSIRQMQATSPADGEPLPVAPEKTTSCDIPISPAGIPKVNSDQAFPAELREPVVPLRPRAATAPALSTSQSESFMRVHDLELDSRPESESSTISSSTLSLPNAAPSEFVFVDHNVTSILDNLSRLGYSVATDESDRFKPTGDTKRLLNKYASTSVDDASLRDWPIQPWYAPRGRDILVWTGGVSHTGFGSDWPVCKGRALMQTSARNLLEYLLDSSRIKEYNKMSQGREDVCIIQSGVDCTREDSAFGFAGDCKIIKSLNKPRLIPKTIEMLSLMYAQNLETAPGSYMIVSRSVFEDDSGEHKCTRSTIRTEMLLGVTMIRPVEYEVCELTTINHVYAPGVPEMLAKRAAPSQAFGMLRDLQNIFQTGKK